MSFEINLVRGANIDNILNKEFNIYIGISLGNKFFTKDNLRECLRFAFKYTKERVGILVADTLHSINYEVKDEMNSERARKKALRFGDKIILELKELINELSEEDKKRVDILRWEDVKSEKYYDKFLFQIEEEFEKNPEFKKALINIVEEYFDNQIISDDKKIKLCSYLIEELPNLLNGINYNNIYYNCYIGQKDCLLTQLVDKIQTKQIFQQMSNKVVKGSNVFVDLKTK